MLAILLLIAAVIILVVAFGTVSISAFKERAISAGISFIVLGLICILLALYVSYSVGIFNLKG